MLPWVSDSGTPSISITGSINDVLLMKVCLSCGVSFPGDQWVCPSCNSRPPLIEGYLAFAPELATANDGFRQEYFEQLEKIEANHFWFRSRNRLIFQAFEKYFPDAENMLEIGCGTGFILSGMEKAFPRLKPSGSELYSEGLRSAAQRLRQAELFQMDARRIPFEEEFDVIGAFDVLEHINEDEAVMLQMHRALRPGGGVIVTVPQHPFLWSSWDDISCHQRRYSRGELARKMNKAGFRNVRITSFFTLLLPMMILSRLSSGRGSGKESEPDLASEFGMPRPINNLCEKICDLERSLLKSGLSFPAGGSLLYVGMKE